MTTPHRAGLYLRISQDRTGKEAGVTRQERDCREKAAELGWEIVDVYRDNDISATKGKLRREYERMKGDLLSGRIDAILAWHPDRLYRKTKDIVALIELLEVTAPALATVQAGQADLATPGGRAMARMAAVFAEYETEIKQERTKAWHRQRAEAGQPNGGRRPFGYRDDRITVDPAEAAFVREAARRVVAGEERIAIIRDWNARGVPTVTGAGWSATMLRQMLSGPRIAGLRQHRGQCHPAVWPAILSVEEWETVKAAFRTDRASPGRPATYLLSGLLRCGLCGTKMTGNKTTRKVPVYRCPGPNSSASGCGKLGRNAGHVEGFIRDQVLAVLDTAELAGALDAPATDDTLAQIALLERRLDRLKVEYSVEDMWTKTDYLTQSGELEQRINDLADAMPRPAPRWDHDRLPEDLAAWWAAAPVGDRRELIGLVIDRAVIHPVGRGDNRFNPDRVEVVWKA